MSRARTWRSNTAGPRINSIGCRRWRRIGSPTGRCDRRDRRQRSAFAAKAATTTIPIVFAVGEDPVRLGLVASLARPGGNLTGINFFSAELTAKRLELLRELVPGAARVAVLVNPANAANTEATLRDVEPAARTHGAANPGRSTPAPVREIDAAFATFVRERPDALFVGRRPFFNSRRVQLATWRRATRFPRLSGRVNLPKSAG